MTNGELFSITLYPRNIYWPKCTRFQAYIGDSTWFVIIIQNVWFQIFPVSNYFWHQSMLILAKPKVPWKIPVEFQCTEAVGARLRCKILVNKNNGTISKFFNRIDEFANAWTPFLPLYTDWSGRIQFCSSQKW